MKEKFEYFISYKWYGIGKDGYGNGLYTTDRKMDFELIQEMQDEMIEDLSLTDITILCYTLM